jgi:hypothetical protein
MTNQKLRKLVELTELWWKWFHWNLVKTWCLSQLCCFLTDFCNFWLILKLRDGAINPNQWSSLWPVATAFYQLHIIKQSYITVTVTDQNCRETRPSVQFFRSYFWSRFSLVAGPMDQTLKHHAFLRYFGEDNINEGRMASHPCEKLVWTHGKPAAGTGWG